MSQVFWDLSDVCVCSGLKMSGKHSKPLVKSAPYPISPKLGVSSQVPVRHLPWVGVPRETNVYIHLLVQTKVHHVKLCQIYYLCQRRLSPYRNDSSCVITTLFLFLDSQPFLHVASSSSYTTFPLSGLILKLGCSRSSSACSGILTT